MEQIVTTGGTAGLIALLLYCVYQFAGEKWTPGGRAMRAEGRVDVLTTALAAKAEGEREMTEAFRELTGELKATREAWRQERADLLADLRAARAGGT